VLGGKAVDGFAVTVGVFDGVHRGHEAILDLLRDGAKRLTLKTAVVSFDPHPDLVLGKAEPVWLLTTVKERAALLSKSGIDKVLVLNFDGELRQTPPEVFVRRILVEEMGCRLLVVGPGFSLGKGRSGTAEVLRRLGGEVGFDFRQAEPVTVRGRQISSTWIREAVSEGQVELAAELLGRPYSLTGKVAGGSGRGTGLGYPTANLEVPGIKLPPKPGVYAGSVWIQGKDRPAAVNVGVRPTFFDDPGKGLIVEAHILDFQADISGIELEIKMLARLRDEKRFSGKEELIRQITKDVKKVRKVVEASLAVGRRGG
jgi:riboflavin kinase/FMN adenylyltransferase